MLNSLPQSPKIETIKNLGIVTGGQNAKYETNFTDQTDFNTVRYSAVNNGSLSNNRSHCQG
jgi:uncharacterized protein YegL